MTVLLVLALAVGAEPTVAANICLLAPIWACKAEGQLVLVDDKGVNRTPLAGATVQLRREGRDTVIAECTSDRDGHFVLVDVPSGVYEQLVTHVAGSLSVELRLQSASVARKSRDDWIDLGVGMVRPEGCPFSYARTGKRSAR